jgi:hypothetical protein
MIQVFLEQLALEATKQIKKFSAFMQPEKHKRNFSIYEHYDLLIYDAVQFGSFGVTSCLNLQGTRARTSKLLISEPLKAEGSSKTSVTIHQTTRRQTAEYNTDTVFKERLKSKLYRGGQG